jgi:6-phosphogluconate dehydrogenase
VKLGMVGLGRMGSGMTERLRRDGHTVQTYDPKVDSTASSLQELAAQLEPPRAVWMMIPAGEITESTVKELLAILEAGDVLVDGGNSNFHDSKRRNTAAAKQGVHFLDVGVSGGIWGLEEGFCLMAGGAEEPIRQLEPAFHTLAPEGGWANVGPSGAGHFVKMAHNGIEYGLMQAYAEGFEIMQASEFDLDLEQIAGIWRYGSVVRSWLLELLRNSFETHGVELADVAGYVDDSGEGRWSVLEAIGEDVPAPAITLSLFARFASRQDESFAAKINAALREQFGGHAIKAETTSQ